MIKYANAAKGVRVIDPQRYYGMRKCDHTTARHGVIEEVYGLTMNVRWDDGSCTNELIGFPSFINFDNPDYVVPHSQNEE